MSNYIESDRLILRRIALKDVTETYLAWLTDTEVNQFLESRFQSFSLKDIEQYVSQLENDSDNMMFIIMLKETHRHIGNIKLGPINWTHKFAEIGLLIGEKDCWGKGYGHEAIKLICQYAFKTVKLNKLSAGCYENNMGSLKAFLKAGFTLEGIYKKQYLYNENYINSLKLGLLSHE